ncbi:protein lethal(2)essential for life-like [Belonocnema kinseyi]|uniref:protein lethal(2)essential for life-like n=1 Tax=Belonocnema kinseyi TaxID=2817044 RepID=UPI00143DBE75|nr:protein lethal(2)essential for life-like [Belonocnema kinseyi]
MSLFPLLFSTWWAGLDRPHVLMDQNFGSCICPDDLSPISWTENYYFPQIRDRFAFTDYCNRPLADPLTEEECSNWTLPAGKDTFKVVLDVKHFKPEEINVRIVNRFVIVEAKHEEKKDKHGLISRQFDRKFCVPAQVDIDQLKSKLSSDGVLTITAPVKKEGKVTEKGNVNKVEQTGKPASSESAEKPKETSTDKVDKTEKGNVSKVERTGKPAIPESAEKPQETSTDKTKRV